MRTTKHNLHGSRPARPSTSTPGPRLSTHLRLGSARRQPGAQQRGVHHVSRGLPLRGRQQRAQRRLRKGMGGSRQGAREQARGRGLL